jgi:gamma-glutamyltranspeptidase / glutathione hydrolase
MRTTLHLLALSLCACTPPAVDDTAPLIDTAPPPAGGIIAATSGTAAIEAGVVVLDEGGTAMDAAMTIAMSQIALTVGSWNSYAGIMGIVVYDAETGELSSLHGNYGTFAGETDAMSIPADEPSGRTALVPGFMAAAEAAHTEHGVLPWARIFEPAIALAEDGFEVDVYLDYYIDYRQDVLSRRDETWAVFTDADGEPWSEGDIITQPALALTLRAVAEQGSGYMYSGAWAEHFVQAVGEEGGAVTAADLSGYSADWSEPLSTEYAGHTVVTMGDRELGSVQIIEALNMAEAVGLAAMGPWWESGEALYWMVRITQVNQLLTWVQDYYPDYVDYVTDALPGVVLEDAARVDPDQAALLVSYVQDGTWLELMDLFGYSRGSGTHSDAIAVIDARGNAVALTHSINTSMWGGTGIFVDGVSIPDSASFQQQLLAQITPGDPLPTPLNPCIALEDGVPVLAGSTVGNVHYAQVQRLAAVLGLGLGPDEAVQTPMLSGYAFSEIVATGAFPAEVVDEANALGAGITVTTDSSQPAWVGVALDDHGTYSGGAEPWLEVVGAAVASTGL